MPSPPVERLVRRTTSIPQLLMRRIQETPDREAYRYPVGDQWRSITWRQSGERVRAIAAGLLSLGLAREERVGILSNTRVEWLLVDLGIMSAGGATTTVYPSSTPDETAYILADSETRFAVVEDDSQLVKLVAHRAELPRLAKVILLDGAPSDPLKDWVMTLAELEARGAALLAREPRSIDDAIAGIHGDHLATLIYTSGTTGKAKGVRLIHENWAYCADAIDATHLWGADDVQYLWLPLSHSFGKVLMAGHIASGSVTAVDGRIPKLVPNMAVVRPTIMSAVPRIYEKVYNKIIEGAKQGGAIKHWIFQRAVAAGRVASALRQQGKEPTGLLALRIRLADRLVFGRIRATFGGRIRYLVCGSAPLTREIAEFFDACGILILEGYGLTESSAASVVNRAASYEFGSVGLPLPGTEIKIAAEDGEILIKSPAVMQGYHNLPEATAEALTDGWLHTGDIGEVDRDGFLRITDRKKDLIKTSGGKYIAPQAIEGKLKTICPYISQAIIHGDKRNFVTALITLDEEATMAWARDHGLAGKSYGDVVRSVEAKQLIAPFVDEVNKTLARYETIKQFAILPKDLSIDDGELTPSLKVRRKVVEKKYAGVLDKMYEGSVADMGA